MNILESIAEIIEVLIVSAVAMTAVFIIFECVEDWIATRKSGEIDE